ncbi:hypothetical protein [Dokdonia sp. Hel_I_53]|uniref:hypothetical protein n=1 Tax=Dokdonia sp. Hel_I_53 TaxID=1566287 RepID=UPI00119A2E50|nr:hypothetical protein [Dokdonia sp. Hel_I_53]TVZ52186.1 hypothetical protein OD90_1356 [Dokdonia sp. Hel_I_53]
MKTLKKLTYLTFVVLSLFTTACSDDGEDGMDGIDGIDGEQGPAGEDGNANVSSILLENQTITTGNTIIDIPELTQEIYDTGIVYAYVTVTGNEYWEVLPLSSSGSIILEIDRIEVGRVTLRSTFTQSNLRLRFVLMEGNSLGGVVDFNDYGQVESYLGL